jgi:hypothetical protein
MPHAGNESLTQAPFDVPGVKLTQSPEAWDSHNHPSRRGWVMIWDKPNSNDSS